MGKDKWLDQLPLIRDIHHEEITLHQSFELLAAGVAQDIGTVLLLSGSDLDCSQYNILAVDPWLEVKSFRDKIQIVCGEKTFSFKADIFEVLEALIERFSFDCKVPNLPVTSGLFGYLSYDLKDRIEKLPRTCMGKNLPDLYLVVPSVVLVEDRLDQKTYLCITELTDQNALLCRENGSDAIKENFLARIDKPFERKKFAIDKSGFVSSFTREDYVEAVNRIIQYLEAGDIYQANFSQRFESGFSGDAYTLFVELFERNPASFFSYINAGDHVIVSTSPERFIKQAGRKVETRPIKGTIARAPDKNRDKKNRISLSNSIKDDAELTMIVDLMRNDLSRVTVHDSVIVTEHKRIEPYENVYHLVSIVEGELAPEKTSVDLIKATFPGGSITGCPKIRSMEIIDELEPVKRHIYTGSIGYISFHDSMDLSIAIRTATIVDKKIYFSVGGGIVYDSDPLKEYQETLDKGKTLIDALSGNTGENDRQVPLKAWINGKIRDKKDLKVSVLSEGFQYGAGVFETIKVDNGQIFFLDAHIERMNKGWEKLTGRSAPDITWSDVIRLLIRENNFEGQPLAVKLILAKMQPENDIPCAVAISKPYLHRLKALKKAGLDLVVYPHRRHSFLADSKTMNYLFYDQASLFAKSRGADEALILNADGTVSESNTANLIAIDDRTVIVPSSEHVLAGVTLHRTLTFFKTQGYDIRREPITPKKITGLPNLILTNSLMGAVKVLTIDAHPVDHDPKLCERINSFLFRPSSKIAN